MNTPSNERVLLENLGEDVARITLNRPDKRNAMDLAARRALIGALDDCRGRAKAIILTGSGPAFCAGVDLKEVAAARGADPLDAEARRAMWIKVQAEIREHPAIVIAAVNGFALGGGATLINSSDLAIAAEEAAIGMPEIGFGLYPGLAGPSTQLRLPPKRAAWMVLTGNRISGRTAEEWGLVNRCVPLSELAQEAEALARHIAGFDAVTLEWCKKALQQVPAIISDWNTALEYGESIGNQIRARTGSLDAGLGAFVAGKRNPGQGV
ncbi:MAG: enoyl-CoA hydratase/isomerase family protein [Rhizobiaceae bacterium]|nr:enoyl-CoA hydratase/isomerase family protein [Rhizobiaceae bacterium]